MATARSFTRTRDTMLSLLERRGIHDRCVLAAMTEVPREPFVAHADAADAYADRPLSIGHGQMISEPYVVALMLQALQLQGDEHVLEIGTGSGYSTAVMSQLSSHVYSVERDPDLSHAARVRLETLGYDGIDVTCRDGSLGWLEHAPYDAIVVAAGGPTIPRPLVDQLAVGGRLVMPIGARDAQYLALLTKSSARDFVVKSLGAVSCVPLVGELGWTAADHQESE